MRACTQCGKCCIAYADGGLSAETGELERWASERPDIYAFVRDGEIWHDPETGDRLSSCPWLVTEAPGRYACDIYPDRPEDCRRYPVTLTDMVRDECEMLEPRDLRFPERAQARLERIRLYESD